MPKPKKLPLKKLEAPPTENVVEGFWDVETIAAPFEALADFVTGKVFDVPSINVEPPIEDEDDTETRHSQSGPVINFNVNEVFRKVKRRDGGNSSAPPTEDGTPAGKQEQA